MSLVRSRRKRAHSLDPKAQALLDRMERLRRAGAEVRNNSVALNERILAKLVERDAPPQVVAKIRAALDGRPRSTKRTDLAAFRRAEIARLNSEGLHDGAIARQLKIARAYVCQVRNALGIPPVKRQR